MLLYCRRRKEGREGVDDAFFASPAPLEMGVRKSEEEEGRGRKGRSIALSEILPSPRGVYNVHES